MTVGQYLSNKIAQVGIKHVFGIPGDYILDFYKDLWDDDRIQVINNTDENHSGFAADAYSRVHGAGCVVVTYSVGCSKVINAVQCAFAERSPLIVISGATGISERNEGFSLHHMVNNFTTQLTMFSEITCAAISITDAATAVERIDGAFAAMFENIRPIYIELPRDIVKHTIPASQSDSAVVRYSSDPEDLDAVVLEVVNLLKESKRPAILAGVELSRCALTADLLRFAVQHQIPIALTLQSKSLISESHPLFAGIYSGTASHDGTLRLVEDSDCLLLFGEVKTDMVLGFQAAKFKKPNVVEVTIDTLRVKSHTYPSVRFQDFCSRLFNEVFPTKVPQALPNHAPPVPWVSAGAVTLTTQRFFHCVDTILGRGIGVTADVGDVMFGAADLHVTDSYHFLSPAFYASMGSAIPGAVGLFCASPDVRPIILVGDGAFQMSCTEISTLVTLKSKAIIFVLNNDGYTTERFLLDGTFNDLPSWKYERIVDMVGGTGYAVNTEDELSNAVASAIASVDVSVINVHVGRYDTSNGLRRITERLSQRI